MQANTVSELEAKVLMLSERNARNEANLDMMQEDLEDAQEVRCEAGVTSALSCFVLLYHGLLEWGYIAIDPVREQALSAYQAQETGSKDKDTVIADLKAEQVSGTEQNTC